ncbi:cytochrome P450 2B1-like [Mercenaria mercenaria]|uniref:cytochrome P450 2B1-like n=1 Tax=Mercenaria mercenaria TaxID=6596 RepID=UPI00234ECC13|nr:cytochrome P450 2B1-like [Mercenaria mercenaria]
MDPTIVFIFILVFFVSVLVTRKPKNLPPGYFGIPYIGSLSLMRKLIRGKRPHLVLFEESKRIGNIFRWYLGNQLVVVLSGYDTIHEALVQKAEVFSDRPELNRNPIIPSTDGEHAKHRLRKIRTMLARITAIPALRDFGVGKASIEEKIQVEIETATTFLQDKNGKPITMNDLMQKVVANIIFGIIFGRRFTFNEPELDKTRAFTNAFVSGAGPISLSFFLPKVLVRIIYRKDAENNDVRRQSIADLRKYVYEQLDEHEATFDRHNIRDFVDMYIQMKKEGDESIRKFITKGNVFRAILDLFLAGSETTSTTLDWAFLFMTEYTEVQKKCQEEIETVLGNKLIEYSDRKRLVYVNAVIMEIQRCSNLLSLIICCKFSCSLKKKKIFVTYVSCIPAPLNVVHYTSGNTTLGGYNIPARTLIVPTLYSVYMDTKYFPNPEKFDPDRFIDYKGSLIKNEALMPFSTGPRTCLGEPLARMELFLVFANLLQRFSFSREDPSKPHTMESKQSQITNAPVPYTLRATKKQ